MSDLSESLLPATAPDLSKVLDLLEGRLLSLPVEMITKDPWKVPVQYLDHLAWENSVDVWDATWTEETKRRAISVAAEVHRFKGTPHAIKKALTVFGVEAELLEWWQDSGSGVNGTFDVRAFVSDGPGILNSGLYDASIINAMQSVLNSTSPVSRKWALKMGVKTTAPMYVAAYSSVRMIVRATPFQPPIPAATATIGVAAASFVKITARAATGGTSETPPNALLGVTGEPMIGLSGEIIEVL